jgi:hypothetical protein
MLERKTRGLWRSISSNKCLWISGEQEAKYLLSGHATELIQSTWLTCVYERDASSKIYGIVAADKSNGRYVWVYLYYRHHIWKCNTIRQALEIEDKIKKHNELEMKKCRLSRRLEANKKLITVCNN